MTALQDEAFKTGFRKHDGDKDLVSGISSACERVLSKNKISGERAHVIKDEYNRVLNLLTSKEETSNTILRNKVIDLQESVLPFIHKARGYDILGRFYTEFIRYAGSDQKTGLVLTPMHITDLFCELVDLQFTDKVFDPCCGTGGFLVSAMNHMLKQVGNDHQKHKEIKSNHLFGIEKRPDMFTHACSNMMMRGDGKSNIYKKDCFDDKIIKTIKSKEPNVTFLNPPYNVGPKGQIKFVKNALDCLTERGRCVAICQMSVTGRQKGVISSREELLRRHTLDAVLSMPVDLFHPIGVVTCILILTAHRPHPAEHQTWFAYCRDDGHEKRKNKGRIDVNGKWESIKKDWVHTFRNRKERIGFSIMKEVGAHDEWCSEAYMKTDYRTLKKEDFVKVIKNYIAFKFANE